MKRVSRPGLGLTNSETGVRAREDQEQHLVSWPGSGLPRRPPVRLNRQNRHNRQKIHLRGRRAITRGLVGYLRCNPILSLY